MDFAGIAKKAQAALKDGTAEKLVRENAAKVGTAAEKLIRDNAPRIESAADKLGSLAKDRMPGRAAQIDQALAKVKDVVPGGSSSTQTPTGHTPTPQTPTSPTPEVDRVAAASDDGIPATPTMPITPPSPTPEVDRVAGAQDRPE